MYSVEREPISFGQVPDAHGPTVEVSGESGLTRLNLHQHIVLFSIQTIGRGALSVCVSPYEQRSGRDSVPISQLLAAIAGDYNRADLPVGRLFDGYYEIMMVGMQITQDMIKNAMRTHSTYSKIFTTSMMQYKGIYIAPRTLARIRQFSTLSFGLVIWSPVNPEFRGNCERYSAELVICNFKGTDVYIPANDDDNDIEGLNGRILFEPISRYYDDLALREGYVLERHINPKACLIVRSVHYSIFPIVVHDAPHETSGIVGIIGARSTVGDRFTSSSIRY